MTQEELREDAARKIIEVLKPCLKKAKVKGWDAPLFITTKGDKTERGIMALIVDIIKNPYQED